MWMIMLGALLIMRTGSCDEFYCGTQPECHSRHAGIYLKGFGGPNWAQTPTLNHAEYNTHLGYVLGGALGFHFDILSLEGECSYRRNSVNRLEVDALDIHVTGDIEQWCGFGNVLACIPLTKCFAPYVGAGLGYRHIKPGVNFDESTDTSFQNFIDSRDEWGVYQVIAGVNCLVYRCLSLQADYHYMDGWSNAKCRNHSACIAATFGF